MRKMKSPDLKRKRAVRRGRGYYVVVFENSSCLFFRRCEALQSLLRDWTCSRSNPDEISD